MKKLALGIVGLGNRGLSLLEQLAQMEDVSIAGVCDEYPDRVAQGAELARKYGHAPKEYIDYHLLVDDPHVDAVVTPSSWVSHVPVCCYAMERGKRPATEVGGAYSIHQCWELVRTSQRTGVPVMMLENCCYDYCEQTLLHMARMGMFGELVYCAGGYQHHLQEEVGMGRENRHYRLDNYLTRCCENYPTHDLGPIAKILDIHNGNRFVSLTSTATKAVGLKDWAARRRGEKDPIASGMVAQGDVVTTVIRCARGEVITLVLDTTLPRPYSRNGRIQGTRGLWMEDKGDSNNPAATSMIYLEGVNQPEQWLPFAPYAEDPRYNPLWHWYKIEGVRGGHGGMDYLVLRAFVESVLEDKASPIDVYDAAAWMAVTALSEQSIALGSAPQAVPDFTDGAWMKKTPYAQGRYAL